MSRVVKSYRSLLRAANLAFQNDTEAKLAAFDRIRTEYRLPVQEAEIKQKIQFAKDCAHILRTNVVQGVRNDNKSTPEQPVYNLQLHQESELGDNDSRFGKPVGNGEAQGCCQSTPQPSETKK